MLNKQCLQDYVKQLWNHSKTKIPVTIGKGTDADKPRSEAPHAGRINLVVNCGTTDFLSKSGTSKLTKQYNFFLLKIETKITCKGYEELNHNWLCCIRKPYVSALKFRFTFRVVISLILYCLYSELMPYPGHILIVPYLTTRDTFIVDDSYWIMPSRYLFIIRIYFNHLITSQPQWLRH